ncbi:MAG: 50S ribosomal protein L40e [Candidatus Diapherotrites archaeon]|uniref:50S ribosomal protein L40e n=1 Tax=Candidatus Iainarchaeum sp. TaxID=3101447 RepID=A0A2D6M0X6_9ARCH|nr:50S ribosomal protein L40e [Candidatus Diapherotrites archaeon]
MSFLVRFDEADARIFKNVWICMKCNANNRGSEGSIPYSCRKCGGRKLRLKHKVKKK